MLAKLVYIHPDAGGRMEAHLLPINVQRPGGQGMSESVEGSAENGPTAGVVIVRPEQVDQGRAAVTCSSDGEVCEEGGGFARVYLDGCAVTFETGRSEKIQGKAAGMSIGTLAGMSIGTTGQLDTSFVTSVLQISGKVNEISPS
jgi:hypothetical protein